ncbi:type II secretion system protein GspD, partial [Escherichia coli]|nr:type II secretion system protein GspD [Escherichia coli]
SNPGMGDEMVTRVVPVRNVSVRELAPLLRQLNDNAGGGNVVHYEPSNVLLITGRAAVVNRLVEVVNRVDRAGDQDVDIIKLKFASAGEM